MCETKLQTTVYTRKLTNEMIDQRLSVSTQVANYAIDCSVFCSYILQAQYKA